MTDTPRHIAILLVEDNAADVRLTRVALADGEVRHTLHVAMDGEAALAFLHRQGPYAGAPRPDLVLLDLNLPKKSGWEVLAEIKDDPALKRIPVVILTSSSAEEDILRSYSLHANCYVTKPVNLDEFFAVVKSIDDFWLAYVKLGPGGKTTGPTARGAETMWELRV